MDVLFCARVLILISSCAVVLSPRRAAAQDTTDIVVLGVTHTGMLAAESYQPAVLRAYFDRVKPDAICIERAPEEFARGSHYEFTYEIQSLIVPYARARHIPICPFDWMPDVEDQMLGFGVDLNRVPFLREQDGYAPFLAFQDSAALTRDLFYAESVQERDEYRAWYGPMPDRPRSDFARRLFLYRTFMQAMRIARAAREHRGGRLLVVVGSMHKDDLERILADQPGTRILSPTVFSGPTAEEVARHVVHSDLLAIATFNLLGAQSSTRIVDWQWMGRILQELMARDATPEVLLLQTRLSSLTGSISPQDAASSYRQIRATPSSAARFTWDGVLDRSRVDSFADPFGNLTVQQRAMVEEARELLKAGQHEDADDLRKELARSLTSLQRGQLDAYWPDWVVPKR